MPYLRGYGPTRFVSPETMRSGEQAALGRDLLDLMDALSIPRAALAGYDWGGRAACVVAALWPDRVRCLVTGGGYNIQDIAGSTEPQAPDTEYRLWYQYYFNTRRGRTVCRRTEPHSANCYGDSGRRHGRLTRRSSDATASSFSNPDFVDVVVHSYRHRFGYVAGDPQLDEIERALARQPPIAVPTISLCGADDGVEHPSRSDKDRARFTGFYERRLLGGVGHNIPQEAPQATADALLEVLAA